MSLTKEECLQAVRVLALRNETGEGLVALYPYFKYEFDCLFALIHEHFENPPLKFEELEVGKPYWDNLKECWFIVTEYDPTSYYKYKEINWYLDKNDACYLENIYENEFDENRYYRKQVEE